MATKSKPKPKAKSKPKAKAKPQRKPVEVKRRTRTPRLPGMEDAGIPELERLAERYADVRDSRMELSKQEGEMQGDLLALMRKHGKVEYHHEDVHVWRKVTTEKVKVKIGELSEEQAEKEQADVVPIDAANQAAEGEDAAADGENSVEDPEAEAS